MTDPDSPLAPPRRMTREEAEDPQRKRRNLMIALALVAFAATVMAVTTVRLSQNMAQRMQQENAARVATDVSQRP
jgi:flagellar basal body-associated protein FliL